jgi:hypothetical protein
VDDGSPGSIPSVELVAPLFVSCIATSQNIVLCNLVNEDLIEIKGVGPLRRETKKVCNHNCSGATLQYMTTQHRICPNTIFARITSARDEQTVL